MKKTDKKPSHKTVYEALCAIAAVVRGGSSSFDLPSDVPDSFSVISEETDLTAQEAVLLSILLNSPGHTCSLEDFSNYMGLEPAAFVPYEPYLRILEIKRLVKTFHLPKHKKWDLSSRRFMLSEGTLFRLRNRGYIGDLCLKRSTVVGEYFSDVLTDRCRAHLELMHEEAAKRFLQESLRTMVGYVRACESLPLACQMVEISGNLYRNILLLIFFLSKLESYHVTVGATVREISDFFIQDRDVRVGMDERVVFKELFDSKLIDTVVYPNTAELKQRIIFLTKAGRDMIEEGIEWIGGLTLEEIQEVARGETDEKKGSEEETKAEGSTLEDELHKLASEGDAAPVPEAVRVCRPSDIKPADLFYAAPVRAQVDEVLFLLSGGSELKDKPANILLYGAPGTGKTATAYQIARSLGRPLWVADYGRIREKWYGQAERNLKELFESYHKACAMAKEPAPILLFNEADALFAKRTEYCMSSVDKAENTLQNILLEEMEKPGGAILATTNLATGFDPAFDRRFLYKIEFGVPDKAAQARIWMAKVPGLSAFEAEELSDSFDFTGAEIETAADRYDIRSRMPGFASRKGGATRLNLLLGISEEILKRTVGGAGGGETGVSPDGRR